MAGKTGIEKVQVDALAVTVNTSVPWFTGVPDAARMIVCIPVAVSDPDRKKLYPLIVFVEIVYVPGIVTFTLIFTLFEVSSRQAFT